MKKMPTLFKREFGNKGGVVRTLPDVTPGCEWVTLGEGVPTEKVDGSCCALINGKLYKRYDAKRGKVPPAGAIPCQESADPVTGHWPHWVAVDSNNPGDKWYWSAYVNSPWVTEEGTYEAVGVHFQGMISLRSMGASGYGTCRGTLKGSVHICTQTRLRALCSTVAMVKCAK